MSNDKHTVRLPEVSKSLLLTEVSRAYSHTGNPSALLNRVELGVRQYILECENSNATEDKELYIQFVEDLALLQKRWKVIEENHYLKLPQVITPG